MTSTFIPDEAVNTAHLAYANSIRAHYKFPPMSGVKNGDMENAAIEAAIAAALPHIEKAVREECAIIASVSWLTCEYGEIADADCMHELSQSTAAAIRARKE